MFVRSVLCLLLICVFAEKRVQGRKLPSFIQQCKLKYPEVNVCIQKAIIDIQPRLVNGVPEMHIPQLEPFQITETALNSGDSFQANFKNVLIKRASNFTLKDVDFDVEHNKAILRLNFPVVEFSADYSIVGKVLVLELNGKGKGFGNTTDIETVAIVTGKKKVMRGKEYLLFDKIKMDLKFGGGWLYFDDLFHGNKELSDRLSEIINNNILDVLEEIKPLIEHATGEVILNIIKGVFQRYAVEELFAQS